jgi:hypothetical protein
MYHYHDVSPCINPNFLVGKDFSDCASSPACSADIVKWSLAGFANMTTKTVIGIAKDGHVLYGPYDDAGELWRTNNVVRCSPLATSSQPPLVWVASLYLVRCSFVFV